MADDRVLDAILAAQKSAVLGNMPEENIVKAMLGSAWKNANLPRKVYEGSVDPLSDEGIQGAFDLAGSAFTGGVGRAALSKPSIGQEIGIFAGPRAKNAPIKALHDAFGMKQEGRLADDIWRQTGWGELPDKKWMWEISDDLMQLHPNPSGELRHLGYATEELSPALSHEALFSAYPEMRGVGVARKGTSGGASWSPEVAPPSGVVRIPVEQVTTRNPYTDPSSVLLHELNHQIQAREGWVPGSSRVLTQQAMRKALEEGVSSIPYSQLESAISDPLITHRLYERNLGEMMARATQSRQDLTPLERRLRPPWLDFDKGIENAIVPR